MFVLNHYKSTSTCLVKFRQLKALKQPRHELKVKTHGLFLQCCGYARPFSNSENAKGNQICLYCWVWLKSHWFNLTSSAYINVTEVLVVELLSFEETDLKCKLIILVDNSADMNAGLFNVVRSQVIGTVKTRNSINKYTYRPTSRHFIPLYTTPTTPALHTEIEDIKTSLYNIISIT